MMGAGEVIEKKTGRINERADMGLCWRIYPESIAFEERMNLALTGYDSLNANYFNNFNEM